MQRLPLQLEVVAVAATEDLKGSKIDSLFDQTTLPFDNLARALACRIVDVISLASTSEVNYVELVFEVPVHLRQVRHLRHVAARVVRVLIRIGSIVGVAGCAGTD